MPETAQNLRQRLRETATLALLDAAEATFVEKGFERATMQDVAARAGCAVGTLYVHFKNKDQFFKAIVQRRLQDIQQRVDAALAPGADPLTMLRAFVETHIRWAHQNVAFVNMMCSAMPMRYYDFEARMNELLPDCKDKLQKGFLDVIREGQKKGQIRKDIPAHALGDVLHGVLCTLLDQFAARPEKFTLKEQLSLGWQFIATGLIGDKSRA
jgi:AcrR family transcriptional regulator